MSEGGDELVSQGEASHRAASNGTRNLYRKMGSDGRKPCDIWTVENPHWPRALCMCWSISFDCCIVNGVPLYVRVLPELSSQCLEINNNQIDTYTI